MPESFFILSKDYLELATDEVISIVKMYDRFAKIKINSNLISNSIKNKLEENCKTCYICKNIWTNIKKNVRIILR